MIENNNIILDKEQALELIKRLALSLKEGYSFRATLYEIMKFNTEDYKDFYDAGLMYILNLNKGE